MNEKSSRDLLAVVFAEAERLEYSLHEDQAERVVAFLELLERWGQRIRLSGSRDPRELAKRHLGDAFALHTALLRCCDGLPAPPPCLDVGSGGGLPAFLLLALDQRWPLTLVEARGRKAAFLRTAQFELASDAQIVVHDDRLEALLANASLPLPFGAAWSLATFAPERWLEIAAPLVAPETGLVFAFIAGEDLPHLAPGLPLSLLESSRWTLEDGRPRLLAVYRRD